MKRNEANNAFIKCLPSEAERSLWSLFCLTGVYVSKHISNGSYNDVCFTRYVCKYLRAERWKNERVFHVCSAVLILVYARYCNVGVKLCMWATNGPFFHPQLIYYWIWSSGWMRREEEELVATHVLMPPSSLWIPLEVPWGQTRACPVRSRLSNDPL
jgi:hypothetical protein